MQLRPGTRALQLMLAMLLMTACGAAPTQTPIPTQAPTVTPTRRALPPTFTPEAFATVTPFATAAQEPTLTPEKGLPTASSKVTLPPTFTLEAFATVTFPPPAPDEGQPVVTQDLMSVTPTLDLRQPPLPPSASITVPASCSTFHLDRAATTLTVKVQSPGKLVWAGTNAATSYRIWLRHPDGRFILTQQTTLPSLELNKTLFNTDGVYAFEIVAFNGEFPVCPHLTEIIIVGR